MFNVTHQDLLAKGYRPKKRLYGRFTGGNLPTPSTTAPSTAKVLGDELRLELTIFNAATTAGQTGYWDDEPNVSGTEGVIPPGSADNTIYGPANTIYLAGDAGADLRVWETVLVHPNTPGV